MTQEELDAAVAAVNSATGNIGIDNVFQGVPAEMLNHWHCGRAIGPNCGWHGIAQVSRSTWEADKVCPRCGTPGCVLMANPESTDIADLIWTVEGDDVPDGLQPEEIFTDFEVNAGGSLSLTKLLRALQWVKSRFDAGEAAVLALQNQLTLLKGVHITIPSGVSLHTVQLPGGSASAGKPVVVQLNEVNGNVVVRASAIDPNGVLSISLTGATTAAREATVFVDGR